MKKSNVTTMTVKTVSEQKKLDLDTVEHALRQAMNDAKERVREFAENLLSNPDPLYLLGWSSSTFENAAIAKQYEQILVGIEQMKEANWTLEEIDRELLRVLDREIKSSARSPKRSTSVTSNLADEELLAAKCKALEIIERNRK